MENPIKMEWFGDTTIFGNTHMFCFLLDCVVDGSMVQSHVTQVGRYRDATMSCRFSKFDYGRR